MFYQRLEVLSETNLPSKTIIEIFLFVFKNMTSFFPDSHPGINLISLSLFYFSTLMTLLVLSFSKALGYIASHNYYVLFTYVLDPCVQLEKPYELVLKTLFHCISFNGVYR